MLTSSTLAFFIFVCSVDAEKYVIYPHMYAHQKLATRINCQVRTPQHFHYSSITDLWGPVGGQILVEADITLHCLGDDTGGKYESEALKYRAQISNLLITEKSHSDFTADYSDATRPKRGVGEFFTKSWTKIKKFFKRMFGSKTEPKTSTEAPRATGDDTPVGEEESEEEEIDQASFYTTAFQFLQLADGSVPEIRFSENEVEDSRVRNFKRHLVDSFATQLDQKQATVKETSLLGEHKATYNVTFDSDNPVPLAVAGLSFPEEPTVVVVEKLVTDADIVTLAPSEAPNDMDRMDLRLQQMQVFKGGRLISSSGTSNVHLLPTADFKRGRTKRKEPDVTEYIQSHTTFEIKLQNRQRRAPQILPEDDGVTDFIASSRLGEMEEDDSMKNTFRQLRNSVNMTAQLKNLFKESEEDYDEKLQFLFEMIETEKSLKLSEEIGSLSNQVRGLFSKEAVKSMCVLNVSSCKDVLQLLSFTGGSDTEQVLIAFLREDTALPIRILADIVSDVQSPSLYLTRALTQLANNTSSQDSRGALCLSLGHLASKSDPEEKRHVAVTFDHFLKEAQCDHFLIDLLEAIGNLNFEGLVPQVLKVSNNCRENSAVQLASAHAMRHSMHLHAVRHWIQSRLEQGDCDIRREILQSLMDTIQERELSSGNIGWPLFEFNDVDELLRQQLSTTECSPKDTLLYFSRKKDVKANEIASELRNDPAKSRQRREIWDDLNCQEWTEDDKFRPIQDKNEFASDREIYNKRKSCLAFKKLGVKGANAEIYAGMFAGVKEPSDPPKYKLFTKFVSGLNFLGHQVEIGSFYFYHFSGKTKAYVRILGRTRQEFTQDGCTPTDLSYRPLKHIPLYRVNVGPVQLSLGVHLSSQLALDTACPEPDVYQLLPLTKVRIGGESMATLLFARGSVNLGGNFNYKLQFTFTPSPDMCLKGSHGYDPMSISFESYYQLWNAAKKGWGKARTWRPSFLSWDVTRSHFQPWFEDTCIAANRTSESVIERELE